MDYSQIEIFKRLNTIIEKVFDYPHLEIDETTSLNQFERWDSISMANVIYGIELDFKVKLDINEIFQWSNVGDICKSIEQKIHKPV